MQEGGQGNRVGSNQKGLGPTHRGWTSLGGFCCFQTQWLRYVLPCPAEAALSFSFACAGFSCSVRDACACSQACLRRLGWVWLLGSVGSAFLGFPAELLELLLPRPCGLCTQWRLVLGLLCRRPNGTRLISACFCAPICVRNGSSLRAGLCSCGAAVPAAWNPAPAHALD